MTRTTLVRVAVLAALVAGSVVPSAFVAPVGAAAATPKWTVTKSPSPPGPPIGSLTAVSCPTANVCFAVGGGDTSPLIERWNGRGWSVVHSPAFGDNTFAALNAVSCSSPSSCVAIGYSDTASSNSDFSDSEPTIAERWNGHAWSLIPSPTAGSNADVQLAGISCASAKSCFAVGYLFRDSSNPDAFDGVTVAVIKRWNGTTWSNVAAATPKGAFLTLLSGVSCVSAKSCFAVGSFFSRTSGGSLIEHWNGVRWSVVRSPQQGPTNPNLKYRIKRGDVTQVFVTGGLNGVSCSSTKSCFAVGGGFSGNGLTERWNGTKWKIVAAATLPGKNDAALINAVSCASATDCSAVGSRLSGSIFDDSFDPFGGSALAEHWNGTAWSVQPQPVGALNTTLSSVSCPVVNNCAAVGGSAFAQRWNGTSWKIAPISGKSSQSQLGDVTCVAASSCFAVGITSNGRTVNTLIERRVGAQWKVQPSPNPAGALESILYGISCASANDCTAVGFSITISGDSETAQPLIEHWNGSAWSIVPSPNPSSGPGNQGLLSALTSVDCATATNCTAVGYSQTPELEKPLIERWNGSAWSIVPSPKPAFGELTELSSVSCSGPNKCTAVGYYETGTGDRQLAIRTVALRWNGSTWTLQPTPNMKGQAITTLFSVSCPTATNCSAVGLSESDAGTSSRPIAEHWNGKKWVLVPAAVPHGSLDAGLSAISCRGTSICWAVGSNSTATATKTLAERWNGHAWTIVPTPNPPSATGAELVGVSCASRTTCTAVGDFGANDGIFTLIERGP